MYSIGKILGRETEESLLHAKKEASSLWLQTIVHVSYCPTYISSFASQLSMIHYLFHEKANRKKNKWSKETKFMQNSSTNSRVFFFNTVVDNIIFFKKTIGPGWWDSNWRHESDFKTFASYLIWISHSTPEPYIS